MKAQVLPFRPELLDTMRKAREAMAGTVFDPVTIKSLLNGAAGEGRSVYVIEAPLDLRDTTAGRRIEAWCKAEGLRTDWSRRAAADAHSEAAYDLVVSWGNPVT